MVNFTISDAYDAGEHLMTLTGLRFKLPEHDSSYSGLYVLKTCENAKLSFTMRSGDPASFSLEGLVDGQGHFKLVTAQWRGSVALTMNALSVEVGSLFLSLPSKG